MNTQDHIKLNLLASYITNNTGLPLNEALFKVDLQAWLQTGQTFTGTTYTKTGMASVAPEEAPVLNPEKQQLDIAFTMDERDIIYRTLMDERRIHEIVRLDLFYVGEKVPMSIGIIPMKPIPLSPKEQAHALDLVKRWVVISTQEYKG